jgi:phosphoribosylamine--glycine ligase
MSLKYNILIIGSGAREHAFAWKIKQSLRLNKLFVAPGNAGTAEIAENIPVSVNDFEAIKTAVLINNINLVLVGPEDPIVNGITDFFENDNQLKDVLIIAPGKSGARLEGSKSFSKQFMVKYNIPTAKYHIVTEHNLEEGIAFLSSFNPPYVLKADGLAAGKGVLIIHDRDEACSSLKEILNGKFGEAGKTVVIEQFLEGIEMSAFVLTDGINYVLLPEAKDYKRIGEGDTGLNTGGMGAVSPVPFLTPELQKKIDSLVIHRTIHGLRAENITFKGFIFIGLMISNENPFVIEYNIRMGDPETEVVIPRIANDFVDLLEATALNKLDEQKIEIKKDAFATIIAASKGYPEQFEKGKVISGLKNNTESLIFHSGTTLKNNEVVTNGGRVLAVSSSGKNIEAAVNTSVNTLQNISYDGIYYRKDIGYEFK